MKWYYNQSGSPVGPLDEHEIARLIVAGKISRESLVWTAGMPQWSAAQLTPLAPHFDAVPPRMNPVAPPLLGSGPNTFRVIQPIFPAGFRNLKPLCAWLSALLLASLALTFIAIGSGLMQIDLLERIQTGGDFTADEAHANDLREQIIGLIQLGLLILTVCFFGRWIYVAAHNVRALGAHDLEISPGWAVGYYFVPIVCLWRPFVAMREIWQASRNPKDWRSEGGSLLLGAWWTLWLLSNFAGQVVLRMALRSDASTDYVANASVTVAADALDIPLTIIALVMIRILTARQTETAIAVAQSPGA